MQGRTRVAFLVFSDALAAVFSWAFAAAVFWALDIEEPNLRELAGAWPVVPLFVMFNMFIRLYHGSVIYPSLPLNPVEEFRRLVASSIVVHLVFMAFLGFSRQQEAVSRMVLVSSGLLLSVLSQPFRDCTRLLMKRLGIGTIPCFIAGSKMMEGCLNSESHGRISAAMTRQHSGAANAQQMNDSKRSMPKISKGDTK